jgi:hypothetical protein
MVKRAPAGNQAFFRIETADPETDQDGKAGAGGQPGVVFKISKNW